MASTPRTTRKRPKDGVSSAARVADLGARGRSPRPLEEACARLCRLTARALDVPAVLIALKDEDKPFLLCSVGLEATDPQVGSSRVDLQACKLEYSIVSPK